MKPTQTRSLGAAAARPDRTATDAIEAATVRLKNDLRLFIERTPFVTAEVTAPEPQPARSPPQQCIRTDTPGGNGHHPIPGIWLPGNGDAGDVDSAPTPAKSNLFSLEPKAYSFARP
jgi:hypothetical protein